jgi:Xaa-Pro aminopeptidase
MRRARPYDELLYVQPRDPKAEQWTGRRLGADRARQTLGFDRVADNTAFDSLPLDPKGFGKVLFPEFPRRRARRQGRPRPTSTT